MISIVAIVALLALARWESSFSGLRTQPTTSTDGQSDGDGGANLLGSSRAQRTSSTTIDGRWSVSRASSVRYRVLYFRFIGTYAAPSPFLASSSSRQRSRTLFPPALRALHAAAFPTLRLMRTSRLPSVSPANPL
ncbi:hypothetical protein PYCCODRAFT_621978 [Trametes coccinea BRFM310]|uniref:Secreted protein n=1 Tax=Trametes coccinea (strain BRFM310) TaxID=1353009 RepID=A0A1Y2J2A3_TRAC3|nr:hypothetical protein PYCCODRAFT_621978 [Trametes coccinea BRFM310]